MIRTPAATEGWFDAVRETPAAGSRCMPVCKTAAKMPVLGLPSPLIQFGADHFDAVIIERVQFGQIMKDQHERDSR